MCRRDSWGAGAGEAGRVQRAKSPEPLQSADDDRVFAAEGCLLYTSDAADERSSVDLGGRRIIKKKNNKIYDGRLREQQYNPCKRRSTLQHKSTV